MKTLKYLILAIIAIVIITAIIKQDCIKSYFNNPQLKEITTNNEVQDSLINESNKQNIFYQGEIINFEHGGSYTYIEVKEKTNMTFWIAVESTEVKKGDYIRFQKELVAKKFKSKALNKTFDELMFASHLEYKVSE